MAITLQRTIGFSTAVSLVVGSIIGSGIFVRPAEMAALLGSPYLILLVWVIAGLLTLMMAMVLAEVGTLFPETGGPYRYMQHIYGDFWAYLLGWANFAVINTAGTAAIAFIFSGYFEYFVTLPRFDAVTEHSIVFNLPMVGQIFPLENFGVKVLTVLMLGFLTWMGYRSTQWSGAMQRLLTVIKVLAIALLVGGLFFSGKGDFKHFITNDPVLMPTGFAMITAMITACTGALQAYDGSQMVLYVSGEIRHPGKNIPRSLILGIILCIIIYIITNAAMLYILPVHAMVTSSLVATDAAEISFGVIGGGIIAMLICLNVLGATNGNVFPSPRISFAMAQRNQFFRSAGIIHPKYKTPGNAFIIHFVWMVILVFSGSFYILADMYIFIQWFFYLMMMIGVFILRRRMPDAERPYKVWGYPWMPVLALFFTAGYLGLTLYTDIHDYAIGKTPVMNSVLGILLTIAGVPLYFYFKRKDRTPI